MHTKWIGSMAVVLVVGLLAGCSSGPASATVSGEVTVDGKPLAKGVISFAPADGVGQPATGNIENGKYSVSTTAGKKMVQISAPIVTDKKKESSALDAPWIEITKESLPARYHTKTELTLDVQSGSNTKNWELNTKKK
jgi:hypothetical protein